MPRDPENLSPPPGRPDPLAAALRRLDPAPAEFRRDRLMFTAGAASRASVVRLWQLTAGFMAAVGFAAGMYSRSPPVVDRVVYVDREPAPAPAPARPPAAGTTPTAPEPETGPGPAAWPEYALPAPVTGLEEFLQIRRDVFHGGIGAIPDHGRQPPPFAGPFPPE